jgi:hypothetical protein
VVWEGAGAQSPALDPIFGCGSAALVPSVVSLPSQKLQLPDPGLLRSGAEELENGSVTTVVVVWQQSGAIDNL